MNKYIAYIVDDYANVVALARLALETSGHFECRGFTSSCELIDAFTPSCADVVISDLKMPTVDGAELHRALSTKDPYVSFVVMTAFADVKTAVELMEQGTFTLLEKPFSPDGLVAAALRAAERTQARRAEYQGRANDVALLATLTEEEREILRQMVGGYTNKMIVRQLAVSSRTVDRRRQSILQKLKARSVAEVVALATRIGFTNNKTDQPNST